MRRFQVERVIVVVSKISDYYGCCQIVFTGQPLISEVISQKRLHKNQFEISTCKWNVYKNTYFWAKAICLSYQFYFIILLMGQMGDKLSAGEWEEVSVGFSF